MRLRKLILISFIVLTLANLAVFLMRDRFQYESYAGYRALYDLCDEKCLNKWRQYPDDYPGEEMAMAKKVADSMIGKDTISSYLKIMRLSECIYNRFYKQKGRPSESLLMASPFRQYQQLAASDTMQLWCGNFAQIFSYFCWSQGILSRNIEIMHPGDRHVLNECYITEIGRWVMVDVTNNLPLVRNSTGAFLDLQGFRDSVRKNATIYAGHFIGDSVRKDPIDLKAVFINNYYKTDDPVYYYHRTDNSKVYTFGNKIKRYFLARPWYDIYENKKHSDLAFHVKQVLFVLWLISFFVFLISGAKFRI